MGKKALRETPEEDMTRFKQIRDSTGNARLKALYKEMVDASFGKEFPLLGLPRQPDDRISRINTTTGKRTFFRASGLPPSTRSSS